MTTSSIFTTEVARASIKGMFAPAHFSARFWRICEAAIENADGLFLSLAIEKIGPSQNIIAFHIIWGLTIVDKNKFGRGILCAKQLHGPMNESNSAIYTDQPAHDPFPLNFDLVASPAAEIPSRFITFRMFSQMIFRSGQRPRFSTCQTSSANFSSHEIVFRPFTCAPPIAPGHISWRRACSREYSGKYSVKSEVVLFFRTGLRLG